MLKCSLQDFNIVLEAVESGSHSILSLVLSNLNFRGILDPLVTDDVLALAAQSVSASSKAALLHNFTHIFYRHPSWSAFILWPLIFQASTLNFILTICPRFVRPPAAIPVITTSFWPSRGACWAGPSRTWGSRIGHGHKCAASTKCLKLVCLRSVFSLWSFSLFECSDVPWIEDEF